MEVVYLLKLERRTIIVIAMLILLLLLFLYLFINPGIQQVTSIPTVFQGQQIQYEYTNGMTFITGEQQHVNNPVIHDDQALYVLNGAAYEVKKFYIDSLAGELVIRKNIMSPKVRNKPYFQVVKVPNSKYRAIVHDGKVKVRIQYMYLGEQSTLLEYDLKTRKTSLISHTLIGK